MSDSDASSASEDCSQSESDESQQELEEVMLEVQELAKAELVPFIPAGFLKSDPANSLGHWRQKSTVSEKKNNVLTTNYSCPLAYRCACPVKIRLHESPSAVALELSGKHTPESRWEHI